MDEQKTLMFFCSAIKIFSSTHLAIFNFQSNQKGTFIDAFNEYQAPNDWLSLRYFNLT